MDLVFALKVKSTDNKAFLGHQMLLWYGGVVIVPSYQSKASTIYLMILLTALPISFLFQSTGLPQAEDGNATDSHSSDLPIDEPEKVPSDKANTRTVPDPDSIAPGR